MKVHDGAPFERYGKSYLDVRSFKTRFEHSNDAYLAGGNRINELYNAQPRRTECKLCGSPLGPERDFASHGLEFFICPECGHVNGGHEDTDEFLDLIYAKSGYASTYFSADAEYMKRLDGIYLPKARFLLSSIEDDGGEVQSMKFLDVGAGSGYFVAALERYGADVEGIEPSKAAVDFANSTLARERVAHVPIGESIGRVRSCSADVVSFMGVLEHMRDMRGAIRAVVDNERISYMYFSVPMFSLSSLLEAVFDEVCARQLSGIHNHVFTVDSLEWMYAHYGMRKVSAWTFGADVPDLFRGLSVMLSKRGTSERVRQYLQRTAAAACDEMQRVLDGIGCASETHVLVDVRGGSPELELE